MRIATLIHLPAFKVKKSTGNQKIKRLDNSTTTQRPPLLHAQFMDLNPHRNSLPQALHRDLHLIHRLFDQDIHNPLNGLVVSLNSLSRALDSGGMGDVFLSELLLFLSAAVGCHPPIFADLLGERHAEGGVADGEQLPGVQFPVDDCFGGGVGEDVEGFFGRSGDGAIGIERNVVLVVGAGEVCGAVEHVLH